MKFLSFPTVTRNLFRLQSKGGIGAQQREDGMVLHSPIADIPNSSAEVRFRG